MTKGVRRSRKQEPTGKSSLFQSAKKSRVKANEDVIKLGSGGRGAALGTGKMPTLVVRLGQVVVMIVIMVILLQMDKIKKKMNIIIIANVVVVEFENRLNEKCEMKENMITIFFALLFFAFVTVLCLLFVYFCLISWDLYSRFPFGKI